MTLTIDPDITAPVQLRASGAIGLREAFDIADVLTLTAPEPAVLDFSHVELLGADGLRVLTASVRAERAHGRPVEVRNARPLVDLLLTIVGINDLDADVDLIDMTKVAVAC